ncbi:MAG: segregation/condensation protein A [Minisyncoccia bacterium]
MPENSFKIKTEVFEGPLDLLLSLIEKRKLLINDIALAKVADDYIVYLQSQENFPMKDTANFLVVATTLLLIKSRSLLPGLYITEEEQQDINELEARLKIYKRIKELSVNIKNLFGKKIIFLPEQRKFEPIFSPDESMTKEGLFLAMKEIIKNLPKASFVPKLRVARVISLEEVIENLSKRVQSCLKMSFKDFSRMGKVEKVDVIVSFLAMLELVKRGIINANQEKDFSDIQMENKNLNTPIYG